MLPALIVVLALVAVSTVLGLLWRRTTGRTRATGTDRADRIDPAALGLDEPLGRRVTLLQLSTELCATCRPTARVLRELAERTDGAAHIEVLVDRRPQLADRFAVMQTPTTLLLDSGGVVRGRVAGAPDRGELEQAVARIMKEPDARLR